MANILKRLQLMFTKKTPEPPPRTGYSSSGSSQLTVPWQRSQGRRFIEADLCNMDDNDSIIARSLDKIADYACVWDNNEMGFTIDLAIPEGEKATPRQKRGLELMLATAKEANMQSTWCWDAVRDMAKKVNVFSEVLFDEDGSVAELRQFERSWEIEKHLDPKGNLKTMDPDKAMSEAKLNRESAYTQQNDVGKVIAAFWPFQMVHWKFGAGGGKTYADPMLGCVIVDWKKLRAQEEALAYARISSPWTGYVHNILIPAGASAEEVQNKIDEYKQRMEDDEVTTYDANSVAFNIKNRKSPATVNRDFYIPTYFTQDGTKIEGGLKPLDPSTAALDNINDIYWSVTRVLVACGVPMDYMGLKVGQRAFVDKTSEKGIEAFAKFVKRLQACHAAGINQVMDMQLLLNGLNPNDVPYRVVYPNIIPQSAEIATKIQLNKSQAANYWQTLMIPPALIGKDVLELTPAEIEMWQAHLATAVVTAAKGKGPDDAAKGEEPDDDNK